MMQKPCLQHEHILKKFLIAAVVIITACVSCNKEKVEDEKSPNLVVTWVGETISILGCSLGSSTLTFTKSNLIL